MTNRPRVAVIGFPGSNGDHDAVHSLAHDVGVEAELLDYRMTSLAGFDAVVLPGGFSYGDALRPGAIARFAPVMQPVQDFANSGGPVLGICNGFQVLTEAHLLPGALLKNKTLKFHCFRAHVAAGNCASPWLADFEAGDVLQLPVAHGDGAYYVDNETLSRLEANDQIAFRYATAEGAITNAANHNGSVASIAGLVNEAGNVLGLMPHPERATNAMVGGADGLRLLATLVQSGANARKVHVS